MHYRRASRTGDPDHVHRGGRPPIDSKSAIAYNIFYDMDRRTRARYVRAWRLWEFADGDIKELIAFGTRPNGSLNISKMLARAESAAAIKLADIQ